MKINILQLLQGAKKATGIVVIIDVFRAFSLEAYLIHQNAKEIIPVGKKEIAYEYKEKDPSIVLIGERHGIKLPGFDFGNSPSEIQGISFKNKTIVHTTSAGTQGLTNAIHADEILTGSFVNAKAIAQYIKTKNPEEVSLVCMGWEGKESTEEDTMCAEYIKSLLEEKPYTIDTDLLKRTSGAKFFDVKQNEIFPRQDFYLCVDTDRFPFVLKYEKGKIQKIEVVTK